MKTVYYRTYLANLSRTMPTETPSMELIVSDFKQVSYAEFLAFFKSRTKFIIGIDAIVAFQTDLKAKYAVDDEGIRYEMWRWYVIKDGKKNVWENLTQGKVYRKLIIKEDSVRFEYGVQPV